MVLDYVASNSRRYGGLIILSGGLIGQKVQDYAGDMEKTPVFIGCSQKDPHVPIERVEETEKVFKKLNADVEKYIFEGAHHGIVEYEIEKIKEILA